MKHQSLNSSKFLSAIRYTPYAMRFCYAIRYMLFAVLVVFFASYAHGFWNFGRRSRDKPLQTAEVYFNKGNYLKTIEAINGLQLQELHSETQSRAYWYLGQSYQRTMNLDKALSTYQVAAQLYPDEKHFLLALAGLYHRVGLTDRARPLFEKVLELDPGNPDAHIGLAETFEKLGFLSLASGHYRTALESTDYSNATLWLKAAKCLFGQRRFVEADNAAMQARDISGGDADTWLVLATISFHQGKLTQALARLDRAGKISPGRRDIILRKSLWSGAAGDIEGARSSVMSVLSKNPRDPLALWALAWLEMKAGRISGSTASLEKISGDGPSFIVDAASAMLKIMGTQYLIPKRTAVNIKN